MLKSSIAPTLFVWLIGLATPLLAAEISVLPLGDGAVLAVLEGEIAAGDAADFVSATDSYSRVVLILDSPGGNLLEGLEIGRAVHANAVSTGVGPGMVCASACALIWAAGDFKAMAPSALVGFHAAWEERNGQASTSAVGNALVGAYLQSIGFNQAGIVFATSADPDRMNWMTISDARDAGLDVHLLAADGTTIAKSASNGDANAQISLQLPTGYRWVVLASSRELSGLNSSAAGDIPEGVIKKVHTRSGYLAMIAGPYSLDRAEQILREARGIATDAYLSSGNGFIRIAR